LKKLSRQSTGSSTSIGPIGERLIKDGRYLETIELRNNSTIKPGLGTRIDVFLTRFTFAPINDDGPVVPRSIEVRVSGRALLFINFDETEFIA